MTSAHQISLNSTESLVSPPPPAIAVTVRHPTPSSSAPPPPLAHPPSPTPSATTLPQSPSRQSSLRRKPVPSYLPMPNVSIPASHPFANSLASLDSPGTPFHEVDLFFSPPSGGSSSGAVQRGPAPPLRPKTRLINAKGENSNSNSSVRSLPDRGEKRTKDKDGASLVSATSTEVNEIGELAKGVDMRAVLLGEDLPEGSIASQEIVLQSRSDPLVKEVVGEQVKSLDFASPRNPKVAANMPPPRSSSLLDVHVPVRPPRSPSRNSNVPSISEIASLDAALAKEGNVEERPLPPLPPSGTTTPATEPEASAPRIPGPTEPAARSFAQAQAEASSSKPRTTTTTQTPALPEKEIDSLEDETFSVDRVPSKRKLWEAGTCFLRDEEGNLVCFGDLFPRYPDYSDEKSRNTPPPKTVVLFIRHFWCGQCQDFSSSLTHIDPEALRRANIQLVVISNGSWKMIKTYKRMFKCEFPIYTDGPRRLYALMGMTKLTNDFGPLFHGRAAYHQRHVPGQLGQTLVNIFKLPLAYPGKLTQLGGEFILSPGYNCDFAHRMTNTSNHLEAPDVLRMAGVAHPTKEEVSQIQLQEAEQAELEAMQRQMKEWRSGREAELDRIRRKKAARRGEVYKPFTRGSRVGLGLDDELGEGEGFLGQDQDHVQDQDQDQEEILVIGDEQKDGAGHALEGMSEEEIQKRFDEVMRLEEERAKQRVSPGSPAGTRKDESG